MSGTCISCLLVVSLAAGPSPCIAAEATVVYDMYGVNIKDKKNIERIDEIFYGLKGSKVTGDATYFCNTDEVDAAVYAHGWFLERGTTSRYDGLGIKVSNDSAQALYVDFNNDGFYAVTKDGVYRQLTVLEPREGTAFRIVEPGTAVTFVLDQGGIGKGDISFALITTNYGTSVILLRWVQWQQ